jgi:hypothetical protein
MLRKTQKRPSSLIDKSWFGCFISGLFHYKSRTSTSYLVLFLKEVPIQKCVGSSYLHQPYVAILILHDKKTRVSDSFFV